ncbi:hypothetical protein CDG76_18880 [Nostoc sp. 'Peltigera membranacea cyanobiont' 210A]|uniref:hypothetical protein n=1 Tax=Nostoc sp. 'Peltigera membranacea cyanobiont' 210A TaxID=2014529 RepID=UPI000B953690|nr:hypothetical protein [Nostoc sp. 'Peltigera membranacea cyanobiont' 210A]OYD94009.1 hypothetical protein CDG76_18880 [Nostoc sp. 'Peltigera membranacea cyanobiont' 210A]
MTTFRQQLALALIAATAAIVAAGVPTIMGLGNKSSLELPSATAISTTCDKVTVAKVCVNNLTVQFNSNEPQQVKNSDRIPLKAGDTLRLSNLTYCIPSKTPVNRVEVKVYLFPNGVESYRNGLFTPSNFPINAACHNIGNFQQAWKLEPGQHRVSIPIIKYLGSNRIVDSSFYFNLDVGR